MNNATLNRFFALHFVLPFVLAALALMHLIALHDTAGSNNPIGVAGIYDRLPMAPYFLFKDLITVFLFIGVLSIFVYFMPNVLGDSENYVAANPMQTPPAMNLVGFMFLILPARLVSLSKIKIKRAVLINLREKQNLSHFISFNQMISTFRVVKDNTDKGYISINDTKLVISKLKLIQLLQTRKKKAILKVKTLGWQELKQYQLLVNGVFQAEGYAGGSFPHISKYSFTPWFKISQNASLFSLDFFCLLWVILDKKLNFTITKNHLSVYHIIIYTKNWDVIINKIIPYFSFVYGNKYKGLIMLNEIYLLTRSPENLTNQDIAKIIIMGYNLVNLSQKKISLSEKLKMVLNEKLDPKWAKFDLTKFGENNQPLTILFLLGFILGDGTFSIRIRDSGKGLWFIPQFRIFQKNTLNNRILFNNIVNYLNSLSINSRITISKSNEVVYENNTKAVTSILHKNSLTATGRLLNLHIEGNLNVKAFFSLLCVYNQWFFWKKSQLSPLDKYLILSGIASRHWKKSQLALLRLIYFSKAFPKKSNNYNFWKDKLDFYYNNKLNKAISSYSEVNFSWLEKKDLFYICLSKDKSWLVTLPSGLKIKPKAKYFFFKTYDNCKEKALKAAIEYRDNTLNNWLINNGFK